MTTEDCIREELREYLERYDDDTTVDVFAGVPVRDLNRRELYALIRFIAANPMPFYPVTGRMPPQYDA